MSDAPQHRISLLVGGRQVERWESYDIAVSMTDPVDHYRMSLPFDREAWDLCAPDRLVQVVLDDHPVITGYIDDEEMPDDEQPQIAITGRCKVGRLVTESAPGINFAGLTDLQLIQKCTDPWFKTAVDSNLRNRKVMRGKGVKAKALDEPVKINTMLGTQIEPGQTRWTVIQTLLEQSGYLGFSSGDGKEFIVCKPNYDQEPQFNFYRAVPGGPRASNVLGLQIMRSTGDRYSRVLVVGSGTGTDVNYGATVCARYGEAKNNPATVEGDGLDFTAPKRLIVQRSVSSLQNAQELADREMARRDAHGLILTVRVVNHGQVIAGSQPTIFAPDTLATVEDEITGIRGVFLIESCNYRSARPGAEETVMTLVRAGSELSR